MESGIFDGPKLLWLVEESTEGHSDTRIWEIAARSRTDAQLNTMLDMLKNHSAFTVVIRDSMGRTVFFPCNLQAMQPALAH
ncbi:MAG: hypothetical protein O2807_10045 [bacterium]|nr:hypothetical protein [bacterium]